ncbi:unnamed protein product, partial [Adineta ricciae]
DDRSLLSDESINGLRATRDGVKYFGNGKPHDVPITKNLLDCVRSAHSRYCDDLEKKKAKRTMTKTVEYEQAKQDTDKEKEYCLYDEQNVLHKDLASIQKIIDEGTERLGKAILTRDFGAIGTAQLLIEGGNKKLAMTNTQITATDNHLKQLRKKHRK